MSEDRRLFSRVPFRVDAHLEYSGTECPVEVLDLSLKGALVRPQKPLDLAQGSACSLSIRLGEDEQIIFMGASVAHQYADYLGLACQEIDLDSITHLRRLVELNLADAALLERELANLNNV